MSRSGVVVGATLSLAFAVLLILVIWSFVLSNIDRGMVEMLWGTFTGNGSFGPQ